MSRGKEARNPRTSGRRGKASGLRLPAGAVLFFLAGAALGAPAAYAARVLLERGQKPECRKARPQGVGLPREAERQVRMGFAALNSDRLPEACKAFQEAAKLAPWDARAHFGLGEFFRRVDRAEQAEPCYREALQADPTYATARLMLARVLRDLGKTEEAASHLRKLAENPKCDPDVWLELGRDELRLARPREARGWLERYVQARPKSAYGLAHLGRASAEAGDLKAAEEHYRKALSLDPREALAWLWLGQLLVAEGRKAEAETALSNFRRIREVLDELRSAQRELLRRPNDVIALVRVAKARYQLGRYRESLAALDRALEIQPEDAALRNLRNKVAPFAGEEALPEEAVTPAR